MVNYFNDSYQSDLFLIHHVISVVILLCKTVRV